MRYFRKDHGRRLPDFQEKVPQRNQTPWTNVPEQKREEVLDKEIEMDLAIQEHLFPKGGEVSHSHYTVSGQQGT